MKLGRFASGVVTLAAVGCCVAFPARRAHAEVATFTVTNNLDDGSAGSLRVAIQNANDVANDPAGPDRIVFPTTTTSTTRLAARRSCWPLADAPCTLATADRASGYGRRDEQ